MTVEIDMETDQTVQQDVDVMSVSDDEKEGSLTKKVKISEEKDDILGFKHLDKSRARMDYDTKDIIAEKAFQWIITENEITQGEGEAGVYRSPVYQLGDASWQLKLESDSKISVFLECLDASLPQSDPLWAKCAHFSFTACKTSDVSHHLNPHITQRRYIPAHKDWGFRHFAEWWDLTNGKDGKIAENDSFTLLFHLRIVNDPLHILWNDLVDWDSKIMTGYNGLKNQGATCYMNSLLQSLFFTNAYRKATFQIPTNGDDPRHSIPLALQRVFYNLQNSDSPVDTRELTTSFGWTTLDSFMQHDVQELCVILQDTLEKKMKGTPAEGSIAKLFQGKMKSYIKCINVDFESSREEDYADIQLSVKGLKNLEDSFKQYIEEEMMDGDNKYQAEGFGLQDAKKGIIFNSFPPVLHLQLKRFVYDFEKDMTVKVNDYFEYPDRIDLSGFLSEQAEPGDYHYKLHGVLVHSGEGHGGHYHAFIKPGKTGGWFKFDDDKVTPARNYDVFESNFGYHPDKPLSYRKTNAYYLVYIREILEDEILCKVTAEDIPSHIGEQIAKEQTLEKLRAEEKAREHLMTPVRLVGEANLKLWDEFDLGIKKDKTYIQCSIQKLPKDMPLSELRQLVAQQIEVPVQQLQLRRITPRMNNTMRADDVITDWSQTILESGNRMVVPAFYFQFVEKPVRMDGDRPIFSSPESILLFVKYFDPIESPHLRIVGTWSAPNNQAKFRQMLPYVAHLVHAQPDEISMYEEVRPDYALEEINPNDTLERADFSNGDIVWVVKSKLLSDKNARYKTVDEFRSYLFNKITIPIRVYNGIFEIPSQMLYYEQFMDVDKTHTINQLLHQLVHRVKVDYPEIDVNRVQLYTLNPYNSKDFIPLRSDTSMKIEMTEIPKSGVWFELLPVEASYLESRQVIRVWQPQWPYDWTSVPVIVERRATFGDLCQELVKKGLTEDCSMTYFYRLAHSNIEIYKPDDIVPISTSVCFENMARWKMEVGDSVASLGHYDKAQKKFWGPHTPFVVKEDEKMVDTKKRILRLMQIRDKISAWELHSALEIEVLEDEDVLHEKILDSTYQLVLVHPERTKPEKTIKIAG